MELGLDKFQVHLDKLARLIARVEPALVPEHLCWGGVGGRYFNDLLPLPFTDEALAHLCARIDEAQHYLGREIAVWLATPLGPRRRRSLERWLRGRREFSRLRRADAVIVSYGKSGRTWLRVMLSGFYQRLYGLSARTLLGFDNLHRRDRRVELEVAELHGEIAGVVLDRRDVIDRLAKAFLQEPLEGRLLDVDEIW